MKLRNIALFALGCLFTMSGFAGNLANHHVSRAIHQHFRDFRNQLFHRYSPLVTTILTPGLAAPRCKFGT